jgi:hypothetical protein
MRLFPAIVCFSLVLVTSCSKQQGQPQGAAQGDNTAPAPRAGKDDPDPSLQIDSRQELPFAAGTKVTIWNLRGGKVKELIARLLVCTDGKANKTNEIICRWQDTSRPVQGQLALLVQDGQPFGVKGKRLPSLSLSFQSGAPSSKNATSTSMLIPSDVGSGLSTASDARSISGKEILYAEVGAPVPKKGERSLSLGTEEDLVKSSKDGGVGSTPGNRERGRRDVQEGAQGRS